MEGAYIVSICQYVGARGVHMFQCPCMLVEDVPLSQCSNVSKDVLVMDVYCFNVSVC